MRRVAVRGIIIKDGKLFAQRLKHHDGTPYEYWCTPGGGLDDGESLHDGLTREMFEETGVTPTIGKLLYVQQYANTEKEYLEFFFEITNVDDYETVDLVSTTHGQEEVFEVAFIDTKTTNVMPLSLREVDFDQPLNDVVEITNYL